MPITASEGSAKFSALRDQLDDTIKRRFFYRQAFEIYGGTGGFYTCGSHALQPSSGAARARPAARSLACARARCVCMFAGMARPARLSSRHARPQTAPPAQQRRSPPASAASRRSQNVIEMWRKHFIVEENLMEVDDTCIMPHDVRAARAAPATPCGALMSNKIRKLIADRRLRAARERAFF
jgi:hypothetical protein